MTVDDMHHPTPGTDRDRWSSGLHVIDARSPGSGLGAVRIAAAIAAAAGGSQRILFLGPTREVSAAEAVAAETGAPAGTLVAGPCPPLGDPTLAVRPLRRAMRSIEENGGRFGVLVGWGTGPAVATALAMPGRRRATVSTVGAIPDRRLVRLGRLGPGAFACLSTEASRSFVAASPAFGPIVELPVPREAVRPVGERAAIRAAWNVDERTVVVGVLGDDPRWCDLKHAIDGAGFAAPAGVRCILVVSPRAARLAPTREWTRTIRTFSIPSLGGGDPRFWITDARVDRPWSIAAGLDAAYVPGDGIATAGAAAFADRVGALDRLLGRLASADASGRPTPVPASPLPFLCAMAAGVPVLGDRATAPAAECDDSTSILGDAGDRVAASRAVLSLADDRNALLAMAASARERLGRRYGPDAIDRWRRFLASA